MTTTWSKLWRPALVASLFVALPLTTSGCIEDTDCGICDPDNLFLESISGINFASRKVHLLGPPCQGDACPGEIKTGTYFIEEIGPCEESEEAKESPRGAEEFCKISPLVTAFGIEFIFNNLLDPTSIELIRKRPDNPQLFEVYDWKNQVLEIEGPITRFNGDFVKGGTDRPDEVTRLVNLSCIDNLAAEGIGFSHEDYQDPRTNPCNQLDSLGNPRKMDMGGVIKSYAGITTVGGNSCDLIARYRADLTVLGVEGVSSKMELMETHPAEALIKQAMVEHGRRTIVLAMPHKLNDDSLLTFATLKQVEALISTRFPESEFTENARRTGVRLECPGEVGR